MGTKQSDAKYVLLEQCNLVVLDVQSITVITETPCSFKIYSKNSILEYFSLQTGNLIHKSPRFWNLYLRIQY